MPAKTAAEKVECLNPNTGGKINIDKEIYDLFSKAIHHTVKKGKSLTYTQIVDGVHDHLKEKKVKFDGSVSWYAVTIKNDMEARGVIETFMEKGKKLHRMKR
jgi:hypothetical protein